MKLSLSKMSLSVKISIVIAILVAGIFVTMILVIANRTNDGVFLIQNQNMESASRDLKQNLQDVIRRAEGLAEMTASRNVVRQALISKQFDNLATVAKEVMNSDDYYENALIINSEGVVVGAGISETVGLDISVFPFWKPVAIDKQSLHIDFEPYASPMTGHPVSVIAVPIKDYEGKFIGAIGIPVDIFVLAKNYIVNKKYGREGYPFLMDNRAVIIAHPNTNLILSNLSYEGFMQTILKSEKKEDFFDYMFQGRKKYMYYNKLDIVPWTVATSIYEDDLLSLSLELGNQMIIIGLIALLIIIVFVTLYVGSSLKPLKVTVENANRIALGDLNIDRIQTKSEDEIGSLSMSFSKMVDALNYKASIIGKIAEGNGDFTINVDLASDRDQFGKLISKMLDSLNGVLMQVNMAIEQVVAGSSQVSLTAQAISQGAAEQASSLEEITSSLTELVSQTKRNAENALQGSSLSNKAKEDAQNGNKQMAELVNAMQAINHSTDEIKSIVKIIDDIAFQTNLLALNANVEAARAGKYGKGFAVVAEEVRNLAVRSGNAVKETTVKIDEAIRNIAKVNQMVEMTAKQLGEISHNAVKVTDLASEIAVASQEQSQALEQINKGLAQIDEVTQSNTASSEEAASASEELAGQANQLKNMIRKFKLKDSELQIVDTVAPITRPSQRNLALSHQDDTEKKSIKIPQKVIQLDDDNFGKF